ncbi:hypothetical protein PO124_16450 [Bacillus licheniformis]|nr:hypothetical protein [Bacillus licheniformis]
MKKWLKRPFCRLSRSDASSIEIYKSPESFAAEMNDTLKAIKETTNVDTHLIRSPYGSKPYITGPFQEVIKRDHLTFGTGLLIQRTGNLQIQTVNS